MKSEKKKISIGDRATYFYIKNLKKWMFCPSCKNGKMSFNKKTSHWVCEDCGYSFSEEYFLDDCVFWFCDECETYLNNQEGFDKHSPKHICRSSRVPSKKLRRSICESLQSKDLQGDARRGCFILKNTARRITFRVWNTSFP